MARRMCWWWTGRARPGHCPLLHLTQPPADRGSVSFVGHPLPRMTGHDLGGPPGPVSRAAAARAVAWCEYLQGHARRLYASVTDQARVAAALLAAQLTHGRLPSPFTARDVYRNEWTGLTEPRVVRRHCLAELGWVRSDAVRTP